MDELRRVFLPVVSGGGRQAGVRLSFRDGSVERWRGWVVLKGASPSRGKVTHPVAMAIVSGTCHQIRSKGEQLVAAATLSLKGDLALAAHEHRLEADTPRSRFCRRAASMAKERLGVRAVHGVSNVSLGLLQRGMNGPSRPSRWELVPTCPESLCFRYWDAIAALKSLNGQDARVFPYREHHAQTADFPARPQALFFPPTAFR